MDDIKNSIVFGYKHDDILLTAHQSPDTTWPELLENFWNFMKGVGYQLPNIRILEAIDLAIDEKEREKDLEAVEEGQEYLERVIKLKQALYDNLDASDAEAVAGRLVSLADSGFKVMELMIPEARLACSVVPFQPLLFNYVNKVSIKPAKAKASKKIKFILELGNGTDEA